MQCTLFFLVCIAVFAGAFVVGVVVIVVVIIVITCCGFCSFFLLSFAHIVLSLFPTRQTILKTVSKYFVKAPQLFGDIPKGAEDYEFGKLVCKTI